MNVRQLACIFGAATIAAALIHATGSAAPSSDEKPAPSDAAAGEKKESLGIRYARARLRFAELNLQKANEMNRKVARTLTPAVVAQFTDEVELAKRHLEAISGSDSEDPFQSLLHRSELDLRAAEARLKRIGDASRASPNIYGKIDVDRAKAAIDMANLRLERAKSLLKAEPAQRLAWQIEIISEDLNHLAELTSLSLQNRLTEFF